MTVNEILLILLAVGAALGGIDLMLGNRFGLGEQFEKGFQMLGPVALSMAGILCLAPVLTKILGPLVTPLCDLLRLDPGVFGSILAIDMGGYQLSVELAKDPRFGLFSGVILSSIFGCTLVFTIPVGVGFLKAQDRPYFIRGILIGLITMPFSIVTSGLMLKFPLVSLLWNCLPILLLSVLLGIGVLYRANAMMVILEKFAAFIRIVAVFGLTVSAVSHLSGWEILPGILPLEESMQTISSICIVMLGSMPLAQIIQQLLRTPLRLISERTGLNSASTTALLLGLVTATPALAMLPQMNHRGKVVISAAFVSCICLIGAHFAFANALYPQMVPAQLAAKAFGGLLAAIIAMLTTKDLCDDT